MDLNKLAISGDARDPGLFKNTIFTLRDEVMLLTVQWGRLNNWKGGDIGI
jgi:hypothetical protein